MARKKNTGDGTGDGTNEENIDGVQLTGEDLVNTIAPETKPPKTEPNPETKKQTTLNSESSDSPPGSKHEKTNENCQYKRLRGILVCSKCQQAIHSDPSIGCTICPVRDPKCPHALDFKNDSKS